MFFKWRRETDLPSMLNISGQNGFDQKSSYRSVHQAMSRKASGVNEIVQVGIKAD